MSPKKHEPDTKSGTLFDTGEPVTPEPVIKAPRAPIWSEHKARLIARYLYHFVLVTKHGTYIDGFSGPQTERDDEEDWSARLVLESRPRWLQKFFLFDMNPRQVQRLEKLKADQPDRDRAKKEPRRDVKIRHGDFNELLPSLLASGVIRDREATFALLDQRTFECEWRTVEALARHKPKTRPKIELFYFLASSWLDRALVATKDDARLTRWWGNDRFHMLRGLKVDQRAWLIADRFRKELGYASVKPWAIFEREGAEGKIMYHMLHATDHPEAPGLMARAYNGVLQPPVPNIEQLTLADFLAVTKDLSGDSDAPPPLLDDAP